MLILAVGMPRAGSGWHYNLMHDLIVAAGGTDARQIRKRYHLESILTEVNCNLGALTPRRLLLCLLPSLFGYTYVFKAHAAPTPLAKWLLGRGWMKAAYIYRDPRDALLSAYENGRRAREKGNRNAFAELTDFEHALDFMRQYVAISEQWLAIPSVLATRYEDLLTDYGSEAKRLSPIPGIRPVCSSNPGRHRTLPTPPLTKKNKKVCTSAREKSAATAKPFKSKRWSSSIAPFDPICSPMATFSQVTALLSHPEQ
jgi:hypothetical protein